LDECISDVGGEIPAADGEHAAPFPLHITSAQKFADDFSAPSIQPTR
jgi:hypothetical protein